MTEFNNTQEFVEYLIVQQMTGQMYIVYNDSDNLEKFEPKFGPNFIIHEDMEEKLYKITDETSLSKLSLSEMISKTVENIDNKDNYDKFMVNLSQLKQSSTEIAKYDHISWTKPHVFRHSECNKLMNQYNILYNKQLQICKEIFKYFIIAHDPGEGSKNLYIHLLNYYKNKT